jgi:hypothetical protein
MNFFFRKLSILAALLVMPAVASACFNGYSFHGSDGDGYNDIHGFEKLPKRHFGNLKLVDSLCRDYKDSSDFAVYQIKQGFVGRGLSMLLKLSHDYPREYVIAANLGTAYELSGLNDSALKWIEYSLMLNPNAHEGTEWVHTDILKAKIALAKNPDWLKTHHVLNFNRKNFGKTINGKSPESIELRKVLKAIYIQLTERLPFTAPGDLIMGDICADAAQILEKNSIEVSMAWWKLADEFGVPAVSADPKVRMKLLREAAQYIPSFHEEELVELDENFQETPPDKRKKATYPPINIHYLSFNKFSENKAWKLKDAELLKKVIADLQAIRAVPKAKLTGIQQVSSNTNAMWIWILGGGIVLLLLLFVLLRHKKSGQS